LADGESEVYAKKVFGVVAKKVIRNSFTNARIKAVASYHKLVKGINMSNREAKDIYLTEEEYVQGDVDWIQKDMNAWRWMCAYWASDEFLALSRRNKANRKKNPGLHKYGPKGQIRLAKQMVCLYSVQLIITWL